MILYLFGTHSHWKLQLNGMPCLMPLRTPALWPALKTDWNIWRKTQTNINWCLFFPCVALMSVLILFVRFAIDFFSNIFVILCMQQRLQMEISLTLTLVALTNHANITEWLTLQMKYNLLSEKYKEGGGWRTQSHPKWLDSLHSVHTQAIILVAWHFLAFMPGSWFLLTAQHIGPGVYWNRRGKIIQLLPDVSWPASPGTAPWTCHSTPPLQLTHRP